MQVTRKKKKNTVAGVGLQMRPSHNYWGKKKDQRRSRKRETDTRDKELRIER